jgi:hypothetical protein
MGELEGWKRKREARLGEHDAIQSQINVIRESLGMVTCSTKKAKNAITRGNMDFLKLELERMRGEKVCSLDAKDSTCCICCSRTCRRSLVRCGHISMRALAGSPRAEDGSYARKAAQVLHRARR